MRLKSTNLCCAFVWSPAVLGHPPLLATASYSGAMDENFSNDAFLEIRLVDVKVTDETDLPVVGRVRLPDRAYRVDWSPYTGDQGIIGVACGNGCVYIFSAKEVLAEGPNGGHQEASERPRGLLWMVKEHAGHAVRGFHFNPAKPHFFATGADDGVWQVWTLQDGATGGVCAPTKISVIANVPNSGAIVHLQWHPKYAHIFATATASGVVNVWNLKMATRVTALNVSKASHGATITAIAWNPTAATQLVVGLDDAHPVLQMWDLRTGVVPLREMAGHTGGITGLAWSEQEASMVASCGGDGRTMWWDPNTGEKLGELQKVEQYLVDVQWCRALPAVLATSSFDPMLCVSTAQDVSNAGGDKLSAVPKWLIKPCCASVNMSLTVASLVPGTNHDLMLNNLHNLPMSPKTTEDQKVMQQMLKFPAGTPERTQWLRDNHHDLLAAFASAQSSRQPILDFLNAESDQPNAAARAGHGRNDDDDDDPFAAISHENQKSYEDRSSELVASGKIDEAVDLCMDEHCFDDAFAIAFLSGGELIRKVHQRYVAYIAATDPKKRHVLFAGAIASGDFRALIQADVPWKEVLSAIVAYVTGDGFAESCNMLGDVLREQQNYEGAYHCYVCARNVDAVVDLWRLENRPSREVVQDTILLEETTQRAASGAYLAHCMCDYGMKLLTDGHPEAALQYLQRASRIGDHTAAVLVDRMKYLYDVSQEKPTVPYEPAPVSDEQSASCQAFLAAAEERRLRDLHEQQQQQQEQQRMSSPHPSAMPQPQPQQPQPQPQPRPQPQPQPQPQSSPMMVGGGAGGYMARPAAPPSNVMGGFAPGAPMPPQNYLRPSSERPAPYTASAAPGLPPPPPPPQPQQPLSSNNPSARPPLMPNTASSLLPGRSSSSMPPPPPTSNGSVAYNVNHHNPGTVTGMPPPPPSAGSGAGVAAGGVSALTPNRMSSSNASSALGQPKPRLMPHPVSSFSSMRGPNSAGAVPAGPPPPPPPSSASSLGSRAASQPASLYDVTAQPPPPQPLQPQQPQQTPPPRPGMPSAAGAAPQAPPPQPTASLASVNPAQLPAPLHGQVVQRLQQLVPYIADPRRRAAVEQAAMELVRQMQLNLLPEDLLKLLLYFCNSAGTPAAAQVWAQITDRYGQGVQPYANLRYL
ncbi:protein transport protein Sec31 [Lotmaria passim]